MSLDVFPTHATCDVGIFYARIAATRGAGRP